MKRIKGSFKIVLAAVLLFSLPCNVCGTQWEESATPTNDCDSLSIVNEMDSTTISLLTVGPGDEVWSIYGHTAIRYENKLRHTDLAINYGSFDFNQDCFILRFVFGLTDYEMATIPMVYFMAEYRAENRWVLQQELNLTAEEKLKITQALYENALPENRIYRYNYFYDNCTTRARDMILNHLSENIHTVGNQWNKESYRTMVHQWTGENRWVQFGNDLLLGLGSDLQSRKEASYFLPDSTRKDFDNIVLTSTDGTKRKLVSKSFYLLKPQAESQCNGSMQVPHNIFTPGTVFCALFLTVFLLTFILQWKLKHNLWTLDLLLLTITGLGGIILLAMVFSQHPTVRVNLQILVLNPLSLLLIYPVVRADIKGRRHWYWKMLLVCCILFLIGGIWQCYAEGMYFVALCLLTRCVTNLLKHEK